MTMAKPVLQKGLDVDPIDAKSIKGGRYAKPVTLRHYLTDEGARPEYVEYLKEMSKRKGPGEMYYTFFKQNMSGDIETFSGEDRKLIDAMKRDVKEYAKELV